MKYFLLITFVISFRCFGNSAVPILKKSDIQQMSYNRLLELRDALISFVKEVKKTEKSPTKEKKYSLRFELFNSAYASEEEICFFGGWPSLLQNGICRGPWFVKGNSTIKSLGAYPASKDCTGEGKFLCNPILFGKNDSEGYCVDTGNSFANLTEKCEEVSQNSLDSIVDEYRENPEQLERMISLVKQFCDSKPNYDACDDLALRIKDVSQKDIGTYDQTPGKQFISQINADQIPSGIIEKESITNSIISLCSKKSKDIKGRGILEAMYDAGACDQRLGQGLNNIDEILEIGQGINKPKFLDMVNEAALESTLTAMIANKQKFQVKIPSSKLDTATDVKSYIGKYFPNIKIKKDLDLIVNKVIADIKKSDIHPVDFVQETEKFNAMTSEINFLCREIRNKFQSEFGEQNWVRNRIHTKKEKDFFQTYNAGISGAFDQLLVQSEIGHFLATSQFKKDIFDPSIDHAKMCATRSNYNIIRGNVDVEDIQKASTEISSLLEKNISKIDNERQSVQLNDVIGSKAALQDYLKNDPGLVKVALDRMSDGDQAEFAAYICKESLNIYQNDRIWRAFDYALAGVGTVAGVVLIASGVGSALGVTFTSAAIGLVSAATTTSVITGVAGLARTTSLHQKAVHGQNIQNIINFEDRTELSQFLNRSKTLGDERRSAVRNGFISAVGLALGLKPVTMIRGAKIPFKTLGSGTKNLPKSAIKMTADDLHQITTSSIPPKPSKFNFANVEDAEIVVDDAISTSGTNIQSETGRSIPKVQKTVKETAPRSQALKVSKSNLVRYTDEVGNLDEAYALKAQAAREYFDDALFSKSVPESKEAFTSYYERVMNQMHKKSAYKGSEFGEPGQIRGPGSLVNNRSNMVDYTDKILGRFGLGKRPQGKLEIDGIPTKAQPKNEGITHFYPDGKDLHYYFKAASEKLFDIKNLVDQGKDVEQVRKLIGEYYHIMVNARPYGNVNNSMFMNQVNYLLKRTGHPGIPHGELDHLLTRVNSTQARLLWGKILKGEIPTAKELKGNIRPQGYIKNSIFTDKLNELIASFWQQKVILSQPYISGRSLVRFP